MAVVGEVIAGRYRLARPLATGGMSRIWLATDETATRTGTTYSPSGEIHRETRPALAVLKHCTIPAGLPPAHHELIRHWSLPEARAAARIRHPNVIHTHAVLPSWDGPWLVMEHLPARTLQQVTDESGPLPAARVAALGLAVLSGLRAAWAAGILHLDVKPGNILITADGRAVLTDFSPAVTPAGIRALADAGIILGSPKWIAPERIFDHTSGTASDLWSLGAALYQAVEGHPPFPRSTTAQILQALADPHPIPPRRAGPLTPVLTGLLRRSPAGRLTADQVEHHLQAALGPGRRRRPAPSPPRTPAAPAARHRIPAIIAAVALVTGLTTVAATAEGMTRPGTTGAPPASTTAPGTPSPASSPSSRATIGSPGSPVTAPVSPAVPLPEGFTWWADPIGYRVAVPSGWRRDIPPNGGLTFTSRRNRVAMGITPLAEPPSDVVATLTAAERAAALPDYHRVRIEALPEPASAIWEYTFQAPDGTVMQALQRIIGTATHSYVLEWRATRENWPTELTRFTVVLASFTPSP
ncbi:MAG TPA: serine/threonine-protein kinase [Actinoplanes sp.]|nr:serine/threonine-protein kinase [Actinoplanes sp.]